MLIRKYFTFEILPNGEQARTLKRYCGCARFAYNLALAHQIENYKQGNKFIPFFSIMKQTLLWREQYPWLKECYLQNIEAAIKNLDATYRGFLKKQNRFPKFKKKSRATSVQFRSSITVDEQNSRFRIPRLGWIRYRNSRAIEGNIKNLTIKFHCNKWFAFFQTEFEKQTPLPKGDIIGIDVGIARLATLSDGTYYEPLNSLKINLPRLRILEKRVARKAKGSKNKAKALNKLVKLRHHVTNARKDYLHKISTKISKNHAVVVMENLKIKNMSKVAHAKVKAKSALNRSILDQGWGYLRQWLGYKLKWNGGQLLLVPPMNTSRTCPECGCISKDNRKDQAHFECIDCGYKDNADYVGALNILRAGHAQLACEVNGAVRPSAAGTQ